MIKRIIYQTLEDRGNPDNVELNGPFKCNRKDAWLGFGYYFWESFIENAHWWGQECINFNGGYIICQAEYDQIDELCFNLVDNPEHLKMLDDSIDLLQKKELIDSETTFSRLIAYLKEELGIFNFEAIRANPVNSRSLKSNFSNLVKFKKGAPQYIDMYPTIQICFYKKDSLNLRNYRVIFPNEYNEGYLV